ncbi:mechanosensitive ion channel family protein [Pseudomethylobacillus aquaticus]|uniref:Mechanosensitive ion channel family protein n=1 Tax=Pseudomethylobacillus aquaticus TaxID=2676064 RepID=A0A3N0V7B0_9PROT|nr:mechanosensitive ion channel family protein [Pseudomethylobacillus aquaticus]ROH88599.1 mechanosensitive ion channel family protein [Pseudomethylobacillus aquaticus]
MEGMMDSLDFLHWPELLQVSGTMLRIGVIVLLTLLFIRLSRRGILILKAHLRARAGQDLEDLKRIDTLLRVFRYVATVVIAGVAGMEILHELGVSIAPILTAAGVVGLAVGFGAQSLIKDYFNGFFLLIENQIRQGDVVEAAGKGGLVEEVTLRHIKLRDYDGNVHFIPNGAISTVTNMSRGFAQSVIDVRVAYREDMDRVMQIMRQVGTELRDDQVYREKILDDLEMAGVDRWDESAVILRCRFRVLPLEQWGVRREYLRRLKRRFDEQGIEIPYPHLTLYRGAEAVV